MREKLSLKSNDLFLIARLKKLKNLGLITEEEFSDKKKQLLKQI